MNVLMTGGTGFIGSRFVHKLVSEGHHVYVLTRNFQQYTDTEYVTYISYNYKMNRLPFIHAIVNLAGEPIFGYWTQKKQQRILQSRIKTTEKLIHMMMQMETKPAVFVSGSAIGFYGMSHHKIFTENTTTPGDDFLAKVTEAWENTAQTAEDLGIRTVYTRFGLVLDDIAGSLPLMALPFRLFVGGKIGDGNQWMSWIHIDDCIELLYFVLTESDIAGPVNMTAPYPQRNKEFANTLATMKGKPSLVTTPALLFKLAFGDMHQLITKGQYVLPDKALQHHFLFQYPHLEDALENIFSK